MSNVRVEELAAELGLSPDDLFSRLKAMGFDVVNVTSSVDRGLVEMVRDVLVAAPRERGEGPRRIVSVRKGETEPEVKVRVKKEKPPEPEPEPVVEVLPEAQPTAAEAPVEVQAQPEQTPPVEQVLKAPPAERAVEVEAPPEKASEPVSKTSPPKARARKKMPSGLTALEIEKDLGAVGAQIPTAKVIRTAQPKPGVTAAKEEEETKELRKAKGKRGKKEDAEIKRPPMKKTRKVSRRDLLEEVVELETAEPEIVEAAVEEPTLKVVEIRHTATQQPAHRREQPRRKIKKPKKKEVLPPEPVRQVPRSIRITPGLTVGDLAGMTGTKASEIIKILLSLGIISTINQTVDPEMASLVVSELGFETQIRADSIEDLMKEEPEVSERLVMRPPVVTVMGHVDHGKTSLLDAVRKTDVVSGEAGGITQHIGAHMVQHRKGPLVFLDTPGHEAFTAMRARGAQVTDIVVLVVAADDGVKPQTVEAIDHARAAEVPVVVAINKIDKPEADPDRVMRELADRGIVPEEWGGDSIFVKVSAKKKQGIEELLDAILLQAEVLELKADPTLDARGTVIESKLDRGRGPVATVLVQKGTLRPGDLVLAGTWLGRVRVMQDGRGQKVQEATPSTPVEVVGLPGVPLAGEEFVVFRDELRAKRVTQLRQNQIQVERGTRKKVSLEDFFSQIKQGEVKDLEVVLKADVQGSVEAIKEALVKQSTSEVRVHMLHEGTGGINEGDIILAAASNAIVIGFNVRPDNKANEIARREKVDVRFYNVIYNVVNDIRDALRGLLAPVYREEILGRAEVRETFSVPKAGTIAGCYVTDGVMRRNAQVRVVRDGVVINEGRIGSLKRFKDDAREVQSGYECGIGLDNFNDIKPGDILENYEMVAEKAEL